MTRIENFYQFDKHYKDKLGIELSNYNLPTHTSQKIKITGLTMSPLAVKRFFLQKALIVHLQKNTLRQLDCESLVVSEKPFNFFLTIMATRYEFKSVITSVFK